MRLREQLVLSHAETILDFLQAKAPSEQLPEIMDAIFVPANSHPRLAIHAIRLWERMPAKIPMVIAGARDTDRYLKIAKEFGIPKEFIVWEFSSTNTRQKVERGMKRCMERRQHFKKVAVCAPVFLTFRVLRTFEMFFPEVSAYGCPFNYAPHLLTNREIMWKAYSEFDNLRRYVDKGDIAPFILPNEVALAVSEVKELFHFK